MERLQIAIEKARAKRGTREVARAPVDALRLTPDLRAWVALPEVDLRQSVMDRNRIVAYAGGADAGPYDLLRTRMVQLARAQGWRRIAIVSPHASSGKTTTTANLAFSFGRQTDLRTLVLDLDLRRPSLAKVLGQNVTGGMGDVLEGRVPFADHGRRLDENLAFGFTGARVENSSELLQSQRSAEVLDQIEARYKPDVCLLDMPPLMASDDTLGFLKNVDCALLVVEAEKTPVAQIDVAERQIAQLTNVMGVVLNKCNYADGFYGNEYAYY